MIRKWWKGLAAIDIHNIVFVASLLVGAAFLMWRFLVGGFWHAVGAIIVYTICAVIINVIVCCCVVDGPTNGEAADV